MCLPGSPNKNTEPAALSGRVLLVEDNAANLQIITLRLRQAGADVVTASNGQEALDRIAEDAAVGRVFDVVVMDMQMPVLDGYEAIRQLRSRGFDRPIVALTASARDEDRAECLGLGCDDHLFKPVEWDQLRAAIAAQLDRTRRD